MQQKENGIDDFDGGPREQQTDRKLKRMKELRTKGYQPMHM